MDPEEEAVFYQHRDNLQKHVALSEKLVQAMIENGLISKRHEAKLKHSHNPLTDLLDLLPKLGANAFHKFCNALKSSDQGQVIQTFLSSQAFCQNSGMLPKQTHRANRKEEGTSTEKRYPESISEDICRASRNSINMLLPQMPLNVNLSVNVEVVGNLIPVMIRDSKSTKSDLLHLLKRVLRKDMKDSLGLFKGMTMCHQIVLHNRLTFLQVIFDMGFWEELVDVLTPRDVKEFPNMTAREMAEKSGQWHMVEEIDKLSAEEKNLNSLHRAARSGDHFDVTRLLRQVTGSCAVNEPSLYGKTPLHWAVTSGNYANIEQLIKAGADVFCRTKHGENLLGCAARLNHSHLIHPLVDTWGLDPQQAGCKGKLPLYIAAENGHEEVFKTLLKNGALLSGATLAAAAIGGQTNFIVKLLEEYGIDPNWEDATGRSAILSATSAGHCDVVKLLQARGGNIATGDMRKRNILHCAVESGSQTALKEIVQLCKESDILQSLINSRDSFCGTDEVFLVRGRYQNRPTWHYIQVHRGLLHIFLEKTKGGNIDLDQYGSTSISGWGLVPDQSVVDQIQRQFSHVSMSSTAPADLTPLMFSVLGDNASMVQLLLEENPKLDVQDSYGLIALHIAAMRGNLDIVKALVNAGSSLFLRDHHGHSSSDVAAANGHDEVVMFLQGRVHMNTINVQIPEMLAKAYRDLEDKSLLEVENRHGNMKNYATDILSQLHKDIGRVLDMLHPKQVDSSKCSHNSFEPPEASVT